MVPLLVLRAVTRKLAMTSSYLPLLKRLKTFFTITLRSPKGMCGLLGIMLRIQLTPGEEYWYS